MLVLLVVVALPAQAPAVIHPASVIAGPANDILELDAAAMAPDGSGGLIFRQRSAGTAHVFVAPFVNGQWGGVVQVDTGSPYEASQPAIAAGSEGRLLAVWVQPRNVSAKGVIQYALMGASLQPGGSSFGQGVMIDPNVGEPYTGDISAVAPKLAMAPNGVAYVVYRVILDDCGIGDESNPEEPKCRPGTTDKVVAIRAARFDYLRWSLLGAVNRAPQVAMRNPTPENAPSIGIDLSGDGVVAWQEPGGDDVARIWVRRLFGSVLGNVLEASPESIEGHGITSDADAPAVAMTPYGEARIAFRIEGGPGSAASTPQLYVNSLASELGLNAAKLGGALAIPGAAQSGLGAPSIGIDRRGNWQIAWAQGSALDELTGTEQTLGTTMSLPGGGEQVRTTINPAGGGTTGWVTGPGVAPAVDVREDYAQGAFQFAQLSGNVAGPISDFQLGGSGEGDALLAWTQGLLGQAEVVGAFVQAPPAPFNVVVPFGWVRPPEADVSWERSPDAVAGVTYTVYVDGKPRVGGLTGLSAHLSPVALGDGVHRIQILATDPSGQETMSGQRDLRVDANPPIVKVALVDRRRGVRVTISDKASGVHGGALVISFGDGQRARRRERVTHRYSRAGIYTITAFVRDKAGNSAVVHFRVAVR
jgi:hypothetical protein